MSRGLTPSDSLELEAWCRSGARWTVTRSQVHSWPWETAHTSCREGEDPKGHRQNRGVEDDLKHFPLRDWADFVRGVADQKASMQEHLHQGCESCKTTVRMFSALVEFAKQEVVYGPPSGLESHAGKRRKRARFDMHFPALLRTLDDSWVGAETT